MSSPSDGLARGDTSPKKSPVSSTKQRRPLPEYFDRRKPDEDDGRKPEEDGSQSSAATSYVRADGKRVRRVKRSPQKKNVQSASATIYYDSLTGVQQPHVSERMLDSILVGGIINENDNADAFDELNRQKDPGRMPHELLKSTDTSQETLLKSTQANVKKNEKKPGLLDSSVTPKQVECLSAQNTVTSLTSSNPHKTDEFEQRQATEKRRTQNPYASLLDAAQKAVDALSSQSAARQVKNVSCSITEKETTVNPWLVDPQNLLEEETRPLGGNTANEEVGANPFEEFVTFNPNETTSAVPPNLAQKKLDPDRSMPPSAASSPRSSPAPDQFIPSPTSSHPTSPVLDRYIPPPALETPWHELPEACKTQARDDQVFDNAAKEMAGAVKSSLQQGNAENPLPAVPQLSADALDCESLQEVPSTDAVKQNWEEEEEEVWQPKERLSPPKRRTLPDFFGERTRSCATVDSHIPLTLVPVERKGGPSHVISPLNNDGDYDAYILQTAYAQKRVKVVQLLVFGLLGLAFGFLASFYVQSSCHFLTAHVKVGDSEDFDLHYGMWKYTPLSSVFQGYSFCYKYDGRYTTGAPHIARMVGLVALLCGVYSLGILWIYLVLGKTTRRVWNRAIYASLVAGVFQALTMLFFAGQVCIQNTCSVGPGAAVSIVSTLTWFVLAFEMHYSSPLEDHLSNQVKETLSAEQDSIMRSLEMSDVEHGVTAFFRRLQPRQEPITLNQYRRDTSPRVGGALTPNRTLSPRGFSPGRLGQGRKESQSRKEFVYEPPVFEAA